MSLFTRKVDSLQLSEWLANMTEAFLKMGHDTLDRDKASPDMLVCFTLINATHTAHHALHAAPKIASCIGVIYSELRAYYECLWQLVLLHQYNTPDDHDKISKLCGDVAHRLERTMEKLFRSNPNVERALSVTTGTSYERVMASSVKEYIQGERTEVSTETGNHIEDNVRALSCKIQRLGNLDASQADLVSQIVSQSTYKAPSMIFLTQFDYVGCGVLPDAFYQ